MGRRSSLDQAVGETILRWLEAGHTDAAAAEAAGIGRRTLYVWWARGEAGDGPYDLFLRLCHVARAKGRERAEVEAARKDPLGWLRHLEREDLVRERREESAADQWSGLFDEVLTELDGKAGADVVLETVEEIATFDAERVAPRRAKVAAR